MEPKAMIISETMVGLREPQRQASKVPNSGEEKRPFLRAVLNVVGRATVFYTRMPS